MNTEKVESRSAFNTMPHSFLDTGQLCAHISNGYESPKERANALSW